MTAGPNSFPDRLDGAEPASSASPDRARASACAAVVAALDALMRSSVLKDATTRVLVAFSGGLDSTVLLHAAVHALGAQRCCAVHIHHGLSAQADAWQVHCEQQAGALGCGFVSRRVRLAGEPGTSVEANARDARYGALSEVYREQGAQAVLLGQHADDQAETVLLQLLRGAGLPGLAAMASESGDPYGMVRLRPFLDLTRATLAAYAQQHHLNWIEDESNLDTRYTRNALRHDLMPMLERHFPAYRVALARAARHAAQAQSVLEDVAQMDMQALAMEPMSAAIDATALGSTVLSQERFAALSVPRAANLLRYWIKALGLAGAPAARLDAALQQIRTARAGTALRIDHGGACLRVYRGQISWEHKPETQSEELAAAEPYPDGYPFHLREPTPTAHVWSGQAAWHLPGWRGSFVFKPAAAGAPQAVPAAWLSALGVQARARQGGELMRAGLARPRRPLKKLFQERGVPAWRRDLPLLFAGETLLWVPQLGLNYEFFAVAKTHGCEAAQEDAEWLEIDWTPDILVA